MLFNTLFDFCGGRGCKMKVRKTVKRVMFIKNTAIPTAKRIMGLYGMAAGLYGVYTMVSKFKNK